MTVQNFRNKGIGTILGFLFVYYGIGVGAYFGDRMAEFRGVSYESFTVAVTIFVFMVLLLLVGYLIRRLTLSKSTSVSEIGNTFFYTVTVVDSLYILFLLLYLSI